MSIPVIGNGDVTTPLDAEKMLQRSGVDGVMIGRGSYGRPWIFQQILEYMASGGDFTPDLEWRKKVIIDHFQAMIEFYGDRLGNRLARKHLAWYTKGLVGGAGFRKEVNRSPDAANTLNMTRDFLRGQRQRRAA